MTHARRREDGVWQVTTDRGGQHEFDALVVANGHHWEPRWPEPYPGHFDGLQMHSHAYLNPDSPVPLRGKRVMVVGFGNSAMDIACELGQRTVSERCLLSVRRMSWVMPKWVFGRPVTRQFVDMPHWIPWWVGGAAVGILARIAFGRPTDYGLPQPDHRWFQSHPTISQEFYSRIGHGDVIVKSGDPSAAISTSSRSVLTLPALSPASVRSFVMAVSNSIAAFVDVTATAASGSVTPAVRPAPID